MLFLINGREGYGVERTVITLGRELRRRKAEVSYLALCSGRLEQSLSREGFKGKCLGLTVSSFNRNKPSTYFWMLWSAVCALCRGVRSIRTHIHQSGADVVYLHNRSVLMFGCFGILGTSVKGVCHISNTMDRRRWLGAQSYIYQLACRLSGMKPVGNSKHTAESFGSGILPAESILLGIDVEEFSPCRSIDSATLREQLLVDDQTPVFLVMARIVEEKAQDRVVDAAVRLYEEGQRFIVVFAGGPLDSSYCLRIRERVESSGYSQCFRFPGFVSDPRLYYAAADVVLNSRIDAEPFGNTIIEAMLMKKPVLAYYLGGPSETIVDGETGWLMDSCSVDAHCDGMKRALRDRSDWGAMGRAGRKRAVEQFSGEAFCDRILDLIQK